MNDLQIDTKEKQAQAIADFTTLQEHPGWQLLKKIVELNIEVVKSQILEGIGEKETVETIQRLRDKLRVHQEIIDTPKNMINRWKSLPEQQDQSDDPYA